MRLEPTASPAAPALSAYMSLVHDIQDVDAPSGWLRARLADGARVALAADAAWIAEPATPTTRPADVDVPADEARAPIADADGMLGWLHVRRTRELDEVERELLRRIADHAALSLRHAQSYRELIERRDRLGTWLAKHDEMGEATVRGIGLAGVLTMLESMLGIPVLFEVRTHVRREVPEELQAPSVPQDRIVASRAVLVGNDEIGALHAIGDQELSELQLGVIRYGARLVAIEILKSRGAADSEARLRAGLLRKLLDGGDPADPMIATRAARLGVKLDVRRRVVAFADASSVDASPLLDVARRRAELTTAIDRGGAIECSYDGAVLVALPESAEDAVAFAAAVIDGLAARGADVDAGISRAGSDVRAGAREALAGLRLAQRAPRRRAVVDVDRLGTLHFLLASPNLDEAAALAARELRPLREHDARARAPLMDTLRAWIDSDGHTSRAAELCGVHPNTLKYRIGRAQTILGLALGERDARLRLGLALELEAFLAEMGIDAGG